MCCVWVWTTIKANPTILCVLTEVIGQGGKLVDVLTGVLGIGHAESEFEIERLQNAILEEVPFNHPEIAHWFIAHSKLDTEEQ